MINVRSQVLAWYFVGGGAFMLIESPMKHTFLLFLLTQIMCLAANAAATLRIIALGDSITKGVRTGVTPAEIFSAQLEAALRTRGTAAVVTSVGVGGERTDQALKRLQKAVIAQEPALVTVMYGTNDSYVDRDKSVSRITVDAYRNNLVQILDQLRGAGIRVVLMTPPRWGRTARLNGVNEHPNLSLEKFVAACRTVAAEKKVPLVDHYRIWSEREAKGFDIGAWTTDQCHPNAQGHKQLAAAILPVVLSALAKKTAIAQ